MWLWWRGKPSGRGREVGEHELLTVLQHARLLKTDAMKAKLEADRLNSDADMALADARREIRRISER